MSDGPLTAATVIRFTRELEDRSAAFYAALAERFPQHAEFLARCADECGKHKEQIVRTYQETVTDALETNYAFAGLSLPEYEQGLDLAPGAGLAEALAAARQLEATAVAFYNAVAEGAESLLATIPRAFTRVAKRRQRRAEELAALLA
jgi:rubrerythrin